MNDNAAPAAAIGYSILTNLDGNRQITVQCFVPEDAPDKVVNAKLDRAFRVIDRQKARYDIVGEQEELAKERGVLAQLEEDLARVDADFEKAQASLDIQAEEISVQSEDAMGQGYQEHALSGRGGKYVPRGQTAQRLNASAAAKRNVEDAFAKNKAERDQHRQGVLISTERYHKAIAERTLRIEGYEKMLAG